MHRAAVVDGAVDEVEALLEVLVVVGACRHLWLAALDLEEEEEEEENKCFSNCTSFFLFIAKLSPLAVSVEAPFKNWPLPC